ncbi:hypothetical protein DKX38_000110 [Salix brachista]|uniref:Uncharacterized protein n=1 Tax=Salix brachista TaxID=2182728 RepID=A0A5N5P2E8_9ROSI|nr:hypothetical protein DKX38_000110 [Salix brachista]
MSTATADADGNYLSTPTLDAESSDLLQTIASHGGYAYVRMSTLAASGDFRAAETARDMAWEQLHSGPWHSVLPAWRDAYSMACLHVAKFHYRNGEFKEALRVLDLGLIMGGVLLKKDLESAVETVTAKSREKESEGFEKGPKCKFVEEGVAFDKEEVARVLPEKSLSSKIVVKKSGLSLEGFLREHFLSGSPVIISDCMAHWPARKKWNDMDYLKRVAGDRTVPVEQSTKVLHYEVLDWTHSTETYVHNSKMFVKVFICIPVEWDMVGGMGYMVVIPQQNVIKMASPLQVGKNYLCQEWKQELITFSEFLEKIQSNDCSSAVPTYLAQHQLFDQINELRKDVCIPMKFLTGHTQRRPMSIIQRCL